MLNKQLHPACNELGVFFVPMYYVVACGRVASVLTLASLVPNIDGRPHTTYNNNVPLVREGQLLYLIILYHKFEEKSNFDSSPATKKERDQPSLFAFASARLARIASSRAILAAFSFAAFAAFSFFSACFMRYSSAIA